MILLASVCCAGILGLWWWGLVQAPRAQARVRAADALTQMDRAVSREMSRAETTALAFGAWWSREEGRLDDPEKLQNVISFLEQGAIVSNLILSRQDGDSACVVRKDGEWNLVLFPGGRNPRRYRMDHGRWVPGPTDPHEVYDARTRFWYRFGAAQDRPAWTPEAYRFYTSKVGGFTYTVPVRNRRGLLEGVIGVDVSLEELTHVIWDQQPTPGTRMVVTDPRGLLLVPPRTPEMLDREARFDCQLKPLAARVPPEPLLPFGRAVIGAVRTHATPGTPEMRLQVAIPEEDLFPGLGYRRAASFLLALGAALGVTWSILDLHRRVVRPMRALTRQVEHSQRVASVGMMAPGIVHDVNNQLGVVLGQLDLCQSQAKDHPGLQPRLKAAEGAAIKCAEVLGGLLDFSRQDPGKRELLSLNATVAASVSLLRGVLGRRIRVEEDLGPDVPMLFGESVKLQQIIVNLGLNARDAMPEGGLLTFRTFRAGGKACLEVRDTGCGMDGEVKRRIFEPFYSTKESGKGTGLGLAMVASIVADHGGGIRVESEPGAGTTFVIELPTSLRLPTSDRNSDKEALETR
ncbi:sensor histidine kinase [Mesoterricola silvestris]|uniref:sensor histidine kinase n=1 Tax=Mesoterricola silvestris TaxID=2927979 RepID=UPI00292E60EB|nr:ATP-binding protein [Mesoterricola silvestris]